MLLQTILPCIAAGCKNYPFKEGKNHGHLTADRTGSPQTKAAFRIDSGGRFFASL